MTADIGQLVEDLLRRFPPESTSPAEFLAARFDAGLAWVHFPTGHGGLDLPQDLQGVVNGLLEESGAPGPDLALNGIGHFMAAPTIARFGTEAQKSRFLKKIFTSEEVWCQLFSEPGAGSDLAAVGTRAVLDEDTWTVNGQKVWSSSAQNAQMAILLARTNPDIPKHAGMTFFLCDVTQPGADIRPLRQLTGEAEFNEVFLTDVEVPDAWRLGDVGMGWQVANATLNNERVAISGHGDPREGGHIGLLAERWRTSPHIRDAVARDQLVEFWVEAELMRLAGLRLRQRLAAGQPGPEGSAMKLAYARHAQAVSGFALSLEGEEGLRYDDWTMRRPTSVSMLGRGPGFRYLRAKGNSIEGGTSEILRNVIAERVLGLPGEHRVDKDIAWKELRR